MNSKRESCSNSGKDQTARAGFSLCVPSLAMLPSHCQQVVLCPQGSGKEQGHLWRGFSRRNLSKQLGRVFAIFLCPTYSPYHSWSPFHPKLLLPCAPEMRLVECKRVCLQGELPSPPSDTNYTSEC